MLQMMQRNNILILKYKITIIWCSCATKRHVQKGEDMKKKEQLTIGSEFNIPKLLEFVFPAVIMMIVTSIYIMTDGIFITRFAGSDQLSATNIVYPLIYFTNGIGIMMAMGGNAIVARILGENKEDKARQRFTQLVVFTLVAGIVIGTLCAAFMKPLSILLGSNEALLEYCMEYGRIMMLGAPFSMLQMLLMPFWTTNDKPHYGLVLSLVCAVSNIGLDYLLVKCFSLGLTGAATATIISYGIGAVVPLVFYCSRKLKLYFLPFRWEWKFLGECMYNGVSEMISNISSGVTTFLFNIILMRLCGENGVAAITILLYAQFLFSSVYIGFTNGVAPIFSYNYGAGKVQAIKKYFKLCTALILIAGITIFCLSQLAAPILLKIFVGDNVQLYQMALEGFRIFAVCFLFNGLNIFASGYFTALGDGKSSAVVSILRTLVFEVAAIFSLPYLFGKIGSYFHSTLSEIMGVWVAIPVAEILCLLVTLILLRKQNAGLSEGFYF